jgi:hypothetical protein
VHLAGAWRHGGDGCAVGQDPAHVAGWHNGRRDACGARLLAPVRPRRLRNPPRKVPWRAMRRQPWLAHDHVARPLQVFDQPLGGDPRHRLVRVAGALSPVVAEGEGQGLNQFVTGGGAEGGGVGHGGSVKEV